MRALRSSVAFAAVLTTASVYGAAGDPDLSFGTNGATITVVGDRSEAYALVRQPDGKVVAAGQVEHLIPASNPPRYLAHFLLLRYLADGTLDPTFGTGGIVDTDAVPGNSTRIKALLLQPDGKLVAVGLGAPGNSWDDGGDVVLARYDATGSLDPSFGTGGIVVTDVVGFGDQGTAAVLQPNGRILVAGFMRSGPSQATQDALIARYLPTGALDASFGVGGMTTFDYAGRTDRFRAAILQPSGATVLAGDSFDATVSNGEGVGVLARVDANGSPDGAFGAGGTTELDLSHRTGLLHMVPLADGRLLVSGGGSSVTFEGFAFMARFTADGALDLTYGGGDGIASPPIAPIFALAGGANDTVLAGGSGFLWGHFGSMGLSRFDASGDADTTFGHGGRASIYPGPGTINSASFAIAADPDGSTVTVAGYATDGPPQGNSGEPRQVAVARFLTAAPACAGDGNCDACEHCAGGVCLNGPRTTCEHPQPPGATLAYVSNVERAPRIKWRWRRIAGGPGFDPTTDAVGFCMWWGNLPIYESSIPPATGWLSGPPGVGFRDRDGANYGITDLKVGRAGIKLVAKGNNIRDNPNGFPDALLSPGDASILLQVQLNAESGKCYAASYSQTLLVGTYPAHRRRGVGY